MKTQSFILILKTQQPEIIENDLIERYIYTIHGLLKAQICVILPNTVSLFVNKSTTVHCIYYSTLVLDRQLTVRTDRVVKRHS